MSARAKTPIVPMSAIGMYLFIESMCHAIGAEIASPNKNPESTAEKRVIVHITWKLELIVIDVLGAATKIRIQIAHRDMNRRATHRHTLATEIAFKAFTIDSASFDSHIAS